jgi:hypothetical protein
VKQLRRAHSIADDVIHQLIGPKKSVAPLRHQRRVVCRMLGVHQTPENVTDAVGKFELLHEKIVVALEKSIEHLAVLPNGPCHVIPEHLLRSEPLRDGPGVDLPAEHFVQAVLPGELRDIWNSDFK